MPSAPSKRANFCYVPSREARQVTQRCLSQPPSLENFAPGNGQRLMRTAETVRICKKLAVAIMRRQNGKTPNALKHGVFAAPAILPGESREEFKELLSKLIEEWMPDGATEGEAVQSIAKPMWLKRRWEEFVEIQLFKNSFDPNHDSYSEMLGFSSFANCMRLEPETAFEKYAKRTLPADTVKYLRDKFPRHQFKSTAEWADAIINEIKSVLLPKHEVHAPNEVSRIFIRMTEFMRSAATVFDDLFMQDIAINERLDAMIDRATKRLIQMKAMKQMLLQNGVLGAAGQQRKVVTSKAGN